MMSEKLLLQFGLDSNLMLNCEHKDLPKMKNTIFYKDKERRFIKESVENRIG